MNRFSFVSSCFSVCDVRQFGHRQTDTHTEVKQFPTAKSIVLFEFSVCCRDTFVLDVRGGRSEAIDHNRLSIAFRFYCGSAENLFNCGNGHLANVTGRRSTNDKKRISHFINVACVAFVAVVNVFVHSLLRFLVAAVSHLTNVLFVSLETNCNHLLKIHSIRRREECTIQWNYAEFVQFDLIIHMTRKCNVTIDQHFLFRFDHWLWIGVTCGTCCFELAEHFVATATHISNTNMHIKFNLWHFRFTTFCLADCCRAHCSWHFFLPTINKTELSTATENSLVSIYARWKKKRGKTVKRNRTAATRQTGLSCATIFFFFAFAADWRKPK